tara:strand:- start:16740 stop:17084 length:345 start_codon:yes stop_codon:yes gene_type:complete
MTMHLVRGMTTINTRKRKAKKKTAAVLEEERKMAVLLQRVGYQKGSTYRAPMPSYKVSEPIAPTSDKVGNGYAKAAKQYTGDELAGIGTLHKSNMVPIRKDSNAAKEIATMRRN